MDLRLTGRVALVAGASSGLGYAAAVALAREGCRVAIVARTPSALRHAAERLAAATGAEILPLPADVSVPDEVTRVVAETAAHFGQVDIVLANAGGPPPGRFLAHDHLAWVRAVETNLLSTVTMFRAALPEMIERRWGRLLVITSLSALEPLPGLILSSTVRAGVHGLVKALSDEAAAHGVTVNAIAPGMFGTDRLAEIWEARARNSGGSAAEELAKGLSAIPAGRLGDPAELGALVAFLASEQAGFITGRVVQIDGGQGRAL